MFKHLTALCAVLLLATVATAQPADPPAVASINNAVYTVTADGMTPVASCAVPDGEVITSPLAVSGSMIVFLTRTEDGTALNICSLLDSTVTLDADARPQVRGATPPVFSPTGARFALTHIASDAGVLTVYDTATLEATVWADDITLSQSGGVNPAVWLDDTTLVTRLSEFDNFDSTILEFALLYDGPGGQPFVKQLSKDTDDQVLEMFAADGRLLALYNSGAVYTYDPAADDLTLSETARMVTVTEPLQVSFGLSRSVRGGVTRAWQVMNTAESSFSALEFDGLTSQIAVAPAGDALLYVGADALYIWQGGTADAVPGSEITDRAAPTSVVWGGLNWMAE